MSSFTNLAVFSWIIQFLSLNKESYLINLCKVKSAIHHAHASFFPEDCSNAIAKRCGQEHPHIVFALPHYQLWRARVQACIFLFIFSCYMLPKLEFLLLSVGCAIASNFSSRSNSSLELSCQTNWSLLIKMLAPLSAFWDPGCSEC